METTSKKYRIKIDMFDSHPYYPQELRDVKIFGIKLYSYWSGFGSKGKDGVYKISYSDKCYAEKAIEKRIEYKKDTGKIIYY